MSIIADSYVFKTDTQLKASYQRGPTDVTQIQITYKNTTSSSKSFTIETGRDTVHENITVTGNTTKTGAVLTIPAGNSINVDGSRCNVRFDIPNGHCDIVETIAPNYWFADDGRYGVLNGMGSYGVKLGPTSDPNYPPQPMTLIIKPFQSP